ncbi:hypothetical protein L2E82_24983 [Cichorium intybus]|uniref:Uncharacterized protein n=1 Tax=Cichorium intybus TaxID=13427 RepID=A0ACB9E276_CICIN|nr:hypothetical protein L2E82_24983 [Cichorium intybus]
MANPVASRVDEVEGSLGIVQTEIEVVQNEIGSLKDEVQKMMKQIEILVGRSEVSPPETTIPLNLVEGTTIQRENTNYRTDNGDGDLNRVYANKGIKLEIPVFDGKQTSAGSLCDQFLALKQEESVEDYRKRYVSLAAHLEGISEEVLLSHFINGLVPAINAEVRLMSPINLLDAMEIASKLEDKNRIINSDHEIGVTNINQSQFGFNESNNQSTMNTTKDRTVGEFQKLSDQESQLKLPWLKTQISPALVSLAKEHASYSDLIDSKADMGALLLNLLSKYSEAFSSMIDGKNEDMSTSELSGGSRIHYIFQSIFVKSLQEIDPCEDLTDDDIRTSIQNATGSRSALFVPEVPFEMLIRKQVARLLDPSLQCARFVYYELIKMSHHLMVKEVQKFPIVRKQMEDIIESFLQNGLQPSQSMIGHLVQMEMDYINTSHPKFIGWSKAVEIAIQQVKSSRVATTNPKQKHNKGDIEKETSARTSWVISSIFGRSDSQTSVKENSPDNMSSEPIENINYASSIIHLKEPPENLRPSDSGSEHEAIGIEVTRMLITSYYDIVRKNIQDSVPKAIMHFLVNPIKRELHNVLIRKLYRDDLFEKMLQEKP